MKSILTITALLEAFTGLALLVIPSLVIFLLLGSELTEPGGVLVGRVGGAALISLAIACWLSKRDAQASLALIKALIVYNTLTTLLLIYSGTVEHSSGMGLWPTVLLHALLLGWCIQSIRVKKSET